VIQDGLKHVTKRSGRSPGALSVLFILFFGHRKEIQTLLFSSDDAFGRHQVHTVESQRTPKQEFFRLWV